MSDLIDRQQAIDALCSVCGNDCDKTEFVYDAPQWDQVIMCPEHYVLTTLPSVQPEILACGSGELVAQPEVIRCKDCKHWERTWTNSWSPNYHYCPMIDRSCPSDFYCADAEERRTNE